MDCREARENMLTRRRGQLGGELREAFDAHVGSCAGCRQAAKVDDALTDALQRLPRLRASPALKGKLMERVGAFAIPPSTSRRFPLARFLAPTLSAFATAALVLIAVRVTVPRQAATPGPASPTDGEMVQEAINDHLRVVYSVSPVEIESGGIHQVKPWFTGRLDFAPRVAFFGDDDFPLVGGSVGYFRDRKAAVLVFKRHLHTISLLVFPAAGLPWAPTAEPVGRLKVDVRGVRGFSTLLWRDGDLGYALVSDLNVAEMKDLATKIAGEAP